MVAGFLTSAVCLASLNILCGSSSGSSSSSSSSTSVSSSTKASSTVVASGKASTTVSATTSTTSVSTLATSNPGVYSNCYYNVSGAGVFNTRWVADWSTGITQDMTGISSSAYTVGTSTTSSKKKKRSLASFLTSLTNALSFSISSKTNSAASSVLKTVSNTVSDVSSAASSAAAQAAASMSSSTQLYTSYNDIVYASVRSVILLSNATGFCSFRSDTLEIDLNWLDYHSSYDTSVVSDANTAWHEYRVDWLPGVVNYYIDATLIYSTSDGTTSPGLWLWNAFSGGSDNSVFQIRSIDAYFNRTSVAASIENGEQVCQAVNAVTSAVAGVASSAVSAVATNVNGAVSTVGSVASGAVSAVATNVNGAVSTVGSVASGAVSAVGNIVGNILGSQSTSSTASSAKSSSTSTVLSTTSSVPSTLSTVVKSTSSSSSSSTFVTPSNSAQATVSFTTVTSAWTGTTTQTSTAVNGLTATVFVLTPGVVTASATSTAKASNGYIYTSRTTDSGTASTVQTTTIMPTVGTIATVLTVYPTPVTTCTNTGVAYAGYTNLYAGGQSTSGYPAFTPEVYKTMSPSATQSCNYLRVCTGPSPTGVTNYIAEVNGGSSNVMMYGSDVGTANYVISHTFYLFARQDGYYSFNIPYTDDLQLVWLGSKAVTGWTRANVDITQFWSSGITTQTPQTIAYYLTTGSYLPIRVMWANGGGAGELDFNIYGPDGSTILASNRGLGTGSSSVDIVRFPCNSALGARFPAWGSET